VGGKVGIGEKPKAEWTNHLHRKTIAQKKKQNKLFCFFVEY